MTEDAGVTDRELRTLEAFKIFKQQAIAVFVTKNPQADGDRVSSDQREYALVCMLLTSFLGDSGETFLAKRLMDLAAALIDLPRGVTPPLLKAAKRSLKGGRSPDPTAVWKLRADLCAGIQIMAAGEIEVDEAISKIAKQHRKSLAKLLRPNTKLESSLLSWLNAFEMHEVDNAPAAGHYQTYKRQLANKKMKMPRDKLRMAGEAIVLRAVYDAKVLL